MADNNRTTTTTQIRNMYSDGMSYLNMKFFNTNLCFQLYPFTGRDNTGRSSYDMKNGLSTTVNFEGAFALYQTAKDIIDGKVKDTEVNIPCAAGASLMLQCKPGMNGQVDTIFSIMKNNITIPFKFAVIMQNVRNDNGQIETKCIHTGLGAFMKTVEGYLNGINADRHLDKLTDDYVKSLGDNTKSELNQSSNNNQQNYNRNNGGNNYRGNYNNNGNYKKPYNNYKKSYNGNNNNNFQNPSQNNWQSNNSNTQDFNSYEIKN